MNKYTLIFAISFVGIQASAQLKTDTLTARKIAFKADSLFEAGNYELSLENYKSAISIYGKYSLWTAYFNNQNKIADTYISQGKYDEAQVFIEQQKTALVPYPKLASYFNPLFSSGLGQILLYKGRTDLALEKFQSALDAAPANAAYLPEIYNKLGVCHWVNGNTDLALEYQLKALNMRRQTFGENHIKTAAIYNNIGLTHSNTEPDMALEYYQKALKIYQSIYNCLLYTSPSPRD